MIRIHGVQRGCTTGRQLTVTKFTGQLTVLGNRYAGNEPNSICKKQEFCRSWLSFRRARVATQMVGRREVEIGPRCSSSRFLTRNSLGLTARLTRSLAR